MLQRYLFAACTLVLYTSKQTSDAFQTPIRTTTTSNTKNIINVIVTTQPSFSRLGLEQKSRIPFTLQKSTQLFADNDDDFYSDYDPSMYETMNNSFDDDNGDFSSSNRGGGRGRGSFGREGRGGRNFQYTRDTSRDSSNVDENAIYSLLEQRSEAKRGRDFDTADQIRDDLLQTYSVGVDDRSKTWRTGCSSSGSGMRFGGGGGGRGNGRGRGKPRNFGPNGHDYILSQDAGPSTTSLSLDEINGLLADRLQAKMSRNFHIADEIQMNLIDSGVFVHDGMKEWRADGIPYGDIGGGRGPGRTRDSRNDRNRSYTKSIHSIDVEGADDAMIDKLVMERMKFKIQRDYNKADAIREGLKTKFNVMIDDKLREWSVNGDFGEEHNRQRVMAEQFANRDYIKSPNSLSLDEESEGIIQTMVNERCAFKADRDFDSADAIRDDLKERFDVETHDRMKLWSIGGDFGVEVQQYPEYEISSSSAPVDDEVKRIVQSALKERAKLKKRRNYGAADAVRDDLRAKYGVMVDDRTREWRVRTDFGDGAIGNSAPRDSAPSDSAPTFDNFDEDFDDDSFEEEMAKLDADLSREVSDAIDFMSPKSDVESDGTSEDEDGDDEDEETSAEMADEEYEYEDEEEEAEEDEEYEYEYEEEDEEEEEATLVKDENVKEDESDQNIVAESSNEVGMDEDEDVEDVDDEYEYEYYEEDEEEGEDEVEVDTTLSADELSSMTVVQLKEKLKENGLPVSGKKSELVDRLLANEM